MKLQVKADLNDRCTAFILGKLCQFNTGNLEYFRLYDRTTQADRAGVWGRCTYPSHKKELGYRVRCSVSIMAGEFPYSAKYAIGTKRIDATQWDWIWREDTFDSKEEAFIWLAGHEAFHWLRHSRQIPGANYETQANRYGFAWLDEWRTTQR